MNACVLVAYTDRVFALQLTYLLSDEGIPSDYRHMNGEHVLRSRPKQGGYPKSPSGCVSLGSRFPAVPVPAVLATPSAAPALAVCACVYTWTSACDTTTWTTPCAGFGVHTFKLITQEGKETYIKWHWLSQQGAHSCFLLPPRGG